MKSVKFRKKEEIISYNRIAYILISFHTGISTLSDLAKQYFLKDIIKLEPGSMSRILSIISIPCMLKPFFGLLSDMCPIFGYRRKSYILICGLFLIICWLLMAFHAGNIIEATILLFLVNCSLSFSTGLGEALVVELSTIGYSDDVTRENIAKNNISLFFIIKNIGVLTSSYLKGYFVDVMTLQTIFLISASTPILIIIASVLVKEIKRSPSGELECLEQKNNSKYIKNDENKCLLNNQEDAITICEYKESKNLDDNSDNQFIKFICQKTIIIPLLFIVLFMGVPAYEDPFFYFITNELHFNGNIMGQISFVAALTATIALIIYNLFLKSLKFKTMIVIGNLLYFAFSFCAYILVKGINNDFGISNYVMALFSSATTSMFGELVMIPMLSLACLLCPKNLEATVYSLFVSTINFGSILSNIECSFLTSYFNITSTQFEGLPKLIVISNIMGIIPLLLLCCINDKYFDPELKEENTEIS